MGLKKVYSGEVEAARKYLKKGHQLARQLGNPEILASTLLVMGELASHEARWEEALAYFEDSLAINRKMQRKYQEGILLNNIGTVYFSRGDFSAAHAAYQQSLDICIEVQDQAGAGMATVNIGEVELMLDELEAAKSRFYSAMELGLAQGDVPLVTISEINLGELYVRLGEFDESISVLLSAIAKSEQAGSYYHLSLAWCNLAWHCKLTNDDVLAADLLSSVSNHPGADAYVRERALHLAEELKIAIRPAGLTSEQLLKRVWQKWGPKPETQSDLEGVE